MTPPEILKLRLSHTGLSHAPFNRVEDAVTHLVAVQAQDFAAAKWSLGLRVKNSTDAEIEQTFNDGRIQRIHVMRPTWHFVMPEDIRWMTELTAPRVKSVLASSNRKIGLDDALFAKSNAAIARALEGRNYLTRQELKAVLADIGIETDVQRLSHLITRAELDGLICSGPKRGKQYTYALLDERVPESAGLGREEALETLALRYFTSHGPAQAKDFSWWSGLPDKDAKTALGRIKSRLDQSIVNGKTYWFFPPGATTPDPPPALLLSIYDEYTIAYKDRSDVSEARDVERMIAMGNAMTAVIVIDGKVAGTWRKSTKKDTVEIGLSPFRKLDTDQQEAVDAEVARFGRFVGMPAVIVRE
jgi:hypothetical protein